MSDLCSFKLLSFDVYGTLIDWENGIVTALEPLISRSGVTVDRKQVLHCYHIHEKNQQSSNPNMAYTEVLYTILPAVAQELKLAVPTEEERKLFGNSIGQWPAFTDTVDALRRLSKIFKLVVLSNVDRKSFELSNKGPLQGFPFDAILTAQDIGSYKPDLRNFEKMLQFAKDKFGIEKSQVLQTAQSQFHDHHPASKMGIKSAWIDRKGSVMGNQDVELYQWRFTTLGEMADQVECAFASS